MWQDTLHAGPCLIATDNERGARATVSSKFMPALGMRPRRPWTQEDLVSVSISKDHDPKRYDHGVVYFQRPDGEFLKYTVENEHLLTPVNEVLKARSADGANRASARPDNSNSLFMKTGSGRLAGLALGDPSFERSDAVYGVTPPNGDNRAAGPVSGAVAAKEEGSDTFEARGTVSDPPTVRLVVQNRQMVALHTTGLLEFLDDFCRPDSDRWNSQRPQLWLDDDLSTDQLRALLTELRDEIRTLNGLLSQAGPPDNAILQKVLGSVGTVGMTYLTEAARSLGKWTGTGVFFYYGLGQLMVDVDAMSVKSLCEMVAKVGK